MGELWHSTAIVTRLNSRCVQTKSGSQYKLVGPINEEVTLQQGTITLQFFTIKSTARNCRLISF